MHWNPVAKVNLAALRHNFGVARRYAPGAKCIAVIKSQAYGHGLLEVAKALQADADAFAVARLSEGVQLRKAGVTIPVLLLEGVNDRDELRCAAQAHLQIVAHQARQLALLLENESPVPLSCWLKLDTGMHRLGIPATQSHACITQLASCAWVDEIRLITHLANADDVDDPATERQLRQMQEICDHYVFERSIANSAGVLAWSQSHADWIRPGLMLYGASPMLGHCAADYDLQPVMTLQARLIVVRPVRRGDPVGYGGVWRAPKDGVLGVVGIGYGDGYPRHIQSGAQVLLKGRRAPIVGRVSMDMLTIDLIDVPAEVGDTVTLWGEGLPIGEVAVWANTIPYTLMCQVTARVERHYHG
jgi:alanine racemase